MVWVHVQVHTKKSAKPNWMSTKWTNEWGTVQLGRGLFYCTTKLMTWHPHLISWWSNTYWKFNLCCFFKLWKEWISVWIQAWLLVILYAFHNQHQVSLIFKWESYFNILAIWPYIFCGARDIWNNMRTVVCSIGFHIRKFKLRIWIKFSANSRFK